MKSQESKGHVTPERIMQFMWGYAPPLILEAAVRHRVFDVLDKGPATVEQLSKETGASVRGLRAMMNALLGLELLARDEFHLGGKIVGIHQEQIVLRVKGISAPVHPANGAGNRQ